MTKCPNCGTMNEAGSRFCFQCGQTLATDNGSGTGPTQPITLPGFPPPPAGSAPSGPVSGFPPPPQSAPPGYPQSTGFPQDPYGSANPYGSPPGYPPGTPPGYMMPPEPQRRRRWLWIILGIILGCILVCVAFGIWGFTAGEDTFERWGTQLSEFSTEEAES